MTWDGETYRFGEVVLRPRVVIAEGGDPAIAEELHRRAHGLCFIARSVNFPMRHESEVSVGAVATS
jgi:organic hydroperoxide reductase OsmC/OhrA